MQIDLPRERILYPRTMFGETNGCLLVEVASRIFRRPSNVFLLPQPKIGKVSADVPIFSMKHWDRKSSSTPGAAAGFCLDER